MVTEIRATVALGVGGVRAGVLDEDARGGGSDPLSFNDLDTDDIVVGYREGSR